MEQNDLAEYDRLSNVEDVDILPLTLRLVDQGRNAGMTWNAIAAALDHSRNYVWELHHYRGLRCPRPLIERVKKRDKNRCRRCRARGIKGTGNLHVHHVGDPTRHVMRNLITLCAGCHLKADARKRASVAKPVLGISKKNAARK